MRIVTHEELNPFHPERESSVEILNDSFPVSLRAKIYAGGAYVPPALQDDHYHVSQNEIDEFTSRHSGMVCKVLQCKPMQGFKEIGRYSNGERVLERVLKPLEELLKTSHFSILNEAQGKVEIYSSIAQFPLNHILSKKELATFKITPQPGYLYIGVLIDTDVYCRSVWLREKPISEAHAVLDNLDGEPSGYCREKLREHFKRNQEIPDDLMSASWVGPIVDVVQSTNSRIVFMDFNSETAVARYILKTPLEFPAGFVRATAEALKLECGGDSEIAEKFCRLVYETPAENLEGKDNDKAAWYPHGDSELIGPDVNWRICEDPMYVQNILFARLIGGDLWRYALGHLEYRQEQ